MKRLLNVRIPVILACAFACGIALGYVFIFYGIDILWILAVIPPAAIVFIVFAFFAKKNSTLVLIALTAILLITGSINSFLRLKSFGQAEFTDGAAHTISASVYEKGKTVYGEYLILDDVRADGEIVGGKVLVYLAEKYGDFCDTGYRVTFSATLNACEQFNDRLPSYNAINNIRYVCYGTEGISAKKGFAPFAAVRARLRNVLFENLDKGTAAVAYAMLTGETQDIESGTLESFRYGGIAHIFAVSGLHIGIVYGILRLLCKKFKINKYLAAAIPIIFVFLYAGVCGFTLSSLRAAIMCAVSATARLVYRKYDGLNALAISVVLILLITPLSMFSVGFQLSVCAVGAIFVLSKNIEKVLTKIKIPKNVASTIGVSLSAQAGVMPVMLVHFGYVSAAGLFLNIIFVPVLSVIFVILFISVFISCIIPLFATVLTITALPLKAVISFLVSTGFENILISGFGTSAFAATYFVTLLSLSDKLNFKQSQRACAFSISMLMTVLCAVLI